jgi:hypothetical protein
VAAALLVTRDDEPDRGIVQPVEQGQHHPVSEYGIDAEADEGVDYNLGAGFDGGGQRRGPRVETETTFFLLS